jgi:hypothetical protein
LKKLSENSHAIDRSNASDKVSSSDGTSDRSLLLVVGYTFTGKVGGTTLRELEDDRRVDVSCGLEAGVDDGRRGDVLNDVSLDLG